MIQYTKIYITKYKGMEEFIMECSILKNAKNLYIHSAIIIKTTKTIIKLLTNFLTEI